MAGNAKIHYDTQQDINSWITQTNLISENGGLQAVNSMVGTAVSAAGAVGQVAASNATIAAGGASASDLAAGAATP